MEFSGERLVPSVPGYDDLFLEHISRYLFASRWARGRRVLDAGCGCGYGSYHLIRRGAAAVLGIDASAAAIDYCRAYYQHEALSFAVADVLDTGLDDASFDVIAGFEVFEHVDDPRAFLAEMARLLTPEGALILSTPNARTYVAGTADGKNPFHVREYTPEEFQGLLADSFADVDYFAQSWSGGVSILPVVADPRRQALDAEFGLMAPPASSSWGEVLPARAQLAHCAYLIAVCRRQHPRPPAPSLPKAQWLTIETDLGAGSTLVKEKDRTIVGLQSELEGRTRWAFELEREIAARDQTIRQLQAELEERTRWAFDLEREVATRDATIRKQQAEFEERTRWALALDKEVAELKESLARERIGIKEAKS